MMEFDTKKKELLEKYSNQTTSNNPSTQNPFGTSTTSVFSSPSQGSVFGASVSSPFSNSSSAFGTSQSSTFQPTNTGSVFAAPVSNTNSFGTVTQSPSPFNTPSNTFSLNSTLGANLYSNIPTTNNVFPSSNQTSLFPATSTTTGSVFGTTNNNGTTFGQPSPLNFGNQTTAPPLVVTNNPTEMTPQVPHPQINTTTGEPNSVYSNQLTQESIDAFRAERFTYRRIPEEPPLPQFC
jgi:hypothetical protein